MNIFPLKQILPRTLLCSSLVLLLFLLLDANLVDAGGGKKHIVPVKQIFGVGIGYQKVTHYKPVLVFSRHRRMKQRRRRPGWGWKKGGKSYAPIHIQHHIHKHGRSGSHHRHGGGHHQRKPPRHEPEGWGWSPRGRPPHKGHQQRGYRQKHKGNKNGGYDYQNEGSAHPIIGGGDDYVDEWGGGPNGYGINHSPTSSNHYYGSPYAGGGNYEEDHGGYESEVRNHILSPLVFPTSSNPTTTTNPPPPIYSFTEPSKSDTSVTNIHKDFLRNHLKNFQQFQEYQRSTASSEDAHQNPSHSKNNPMILNPPGPNYSTMDLLNSDHVRVEDADVQYPQYDDAPEDYFSNEFWPGSVRESSKSNANNYDADELEENPGWNEVNRKSMPVGASTTTPSPLIPPPPIVVGVPTPTLLNPSINNNNNRKNVNHMRMNTTPMPKTRFRASPRIDEMKSSGFKFNSPGFFPSFEQFKKMNIQK